MAGLADLLNQETLETPDTPASALAASAEPVRGAGGGLADLVPTDVANADGSVGQAGMSEGEFVWPADVVAMLGDGSSEAGARVLNQLMEQIRMKKQGGKPTQAASMADLAG